MKKLNLKFFILLISILLGTTLLYAVDNNTTDSNNTTVPAVPIHIMPLGDSITYDFRLSDATDPRPTSLRTGYRNHLWYMLKDANYTADFVGSRVAGEAITPHFDPDNEGHPGWTAVELAENTYGYMINSRPDIVLLHIGTNDNAETPDGINNILDQIDAYEGASGQSVRVFVSLIIGGQAAHAIKPFNDNLEKLIKQRIINGDNITLVDMYRTAGLTTSDFIDRIHPNDSGYRKMAQVWFKSLMAPYTPALYAFPRTLVNSALIESLDVNEISHSVTFVTKIPNTGIIFY